MHPEGRASLAVLLWVYGRCAGEGVWLLRACFPSCAAVTLSCFSHCSFIIEMLKSLPADEVQRNRQARSIWFLDALLRFRAQKVIKGKSKAHSILLSQLFPAAGLSVVLTSPPSMSVQGLCAPCPSSCSRCLPEPHRPLLSEFLCSVLEMGTGWMGLPGSTFTAFVLLGKHCIQVKWNKEGVRQDRQQ